MSAEARDTEIVRRYGRRVWQLPIWLCLQAFVTLAFALWVSLRLAPPVAVVFWPFLFPILVAAGSNAFAALRALSRLRPVVVGREGIGHPESRRQAAVLVPWSRVASVREVPSVFAWSIGGLSSWPAPWPRGLIVAADDGGELWIEGCIDGFEELERTLKGCLARVERREVAPASAATLELRLGPRTRGVGLAVILGSLGFVFWLVRSAGWPPTPLEAGLELGVGGALVLAVGVLWRSTQVRYELTDRVLRRHLPLASTREIALGTITEIHGDRRSIKQRFEVFAAGRAGRPRRFVLSVEPGRDAFVRELAARAARRPTWIDHGRALTRRVFPSDPWEQTGAGG